MILLISKLNGLQPYATDIGNMYLEAHTTEKLWIIIPPEFNKQTGHLLVVNKALYGFQSLVQQFNEYLGNCLTNLDFIL